MQRSYHPTMTIKCLDRLIHPSLSTDDIIAQVKHQLSPADEPADDNDEDMLPACARAPLVAEV